MSCYLLSSIYVCRTRFPYHMLFVSFTNNTTVVTSEAGTTSPSGAPEFIPGYKWGSCCSIFSALCYVDHCLSFCPFSFGHCIVYTCLRFAFSYCLFGIFNCFLSNIDAFITMVIYKHMTIFILYKFRAILYCTVFLTYIAHISRISHTICIIDTNIVKMYR